MRTTRTAACLIAMFGLSVSLMAKPPAEKPAEAPKKPEAPAAAPKKPAKEAPPAEEAATSAYFSMLTSEGEIVLELDRAKAPISVANFEKYVNKGHYDGTVFHRIMQTFMIQGGGFDEKGAQKPTDAPIQNESGNGLSNTRGTIAMARTSDLNSATTQFYINTVDNSSKLDAPKYCVFGKVIAGMNVVDKIAATKVGPNGREMSKPLTPVVINKVTGLTKDDAAARVKALGSNDKKPDAKKDEPKKEEKKDEKHGEKDKK